jgi:hypothetical protein
MARIHTKYLEKIKMELDNANDLQNIIANISNNRIEFYFNDIIQNIELYICHQTNWITDNNNNSVQVYIRSGPNNLSNYNSFLNNEGSSNGEIFIMHSFDDIKKTISRFINPITL